ncbi:hypothetical protein EY643_11980 [Halioglobus maricola]|uniref:Uncharacterized protein n=1 Tax=Halioglobus maricola TaxID=2601894 RepID=A0A5P9NKR2_9GAMM|nr:hypothetical protein EY643_11980 [Halioglobus maricola]
MMTKNVFFHAAILIFLLPAIASAADPCTKSEPSAMIVSPQFEMRPRPTEEQYFDEYVQFLVEVANPRSEAQMQQDDCIKYRFRDTMIVDSLAVGAPGFPAGFSSEMYEVGTAHSVEHQYNVASWTVTNANAEDTPDVVFKRLEDTNKYWAERSDKYMQVRTVDDFYKAKKSGKLGVFHNYQGMMPLSQSGDEKEAISNLHKAYDLGVRQIMATYNVDTPYADGGVSNSDGTDQGVHEAGFAVIREMNR